jgi:hypothetical protein
MVWRKTIPAIQFPFRTRIKKIRENWNGLELNGIHQFLPMLMFILVAIHEKSSLRHHMLGTEANTEENWINVHWSHLITRLQGKNHNIL